MKKRILSLALTLVMCLSLLPSAAFAAEEADTPTVGKAETVSVKTEEKSAEPEKKTLKPLASSLVPTFSLQSGEYLTGTQLTMSVSSALPAGHSIYYTVDGTDPTPNSLRYERPLVLAGDVELKAAVCGPDSAGKPVTARYSIKPPDDADLHQVMYALDTGTGSAPIATLPASVPSSANVDLIVGTYVWYLDRDLTLSRIVVASGLSMTFFMLGGTRITVSDGIHVPKGAHMNVHCSIPVDDFVEDTPLPAPEIIASVPKGSHRAAIGTDPETPCGTIYLVSCLITATPGVPGGLAMGGKGGNIQHVSALIDAPTGTVPGPGGTYHLMNGSLHVQSLSPDCTFIGDEIGWLFLEEPLSAPLPQFTRGYLMEKGRESRIIQTGKYAPYIPQSHEMRHFAESIITIPSGFTLWVPDPATKLEVGGGLPVPNPMAAELILSPGSKLIAPEEHVLGAHENITVMSGAEWIRPQLHNITVSDCTVSVDQAYHGQPVSLEWKALSGLQVFDHWETKPADLEIVDNKFIMPDCPVEITAVYLDEDPKAPRLENGTFYIDSSEEYAWLAARMAEGRPVTSCVLLADITLPPNQPRLGPKNNPFGGTFDGNYHTITVDITVPEGGTDVGGLIDYAAWNVETTIRNLCIEGKITLHEKESAGGFLGNLGQSSDVLFENCISRIHIVDTREFGWGHGGFVGYTSMWANTLRFRNCGFSGIIDAYENVGGLAGSCSCNAISFENCYMAGKLITHSTWDDNICDAFLNRSYGSTHDETYQNCVVQVPLDPDVVVNRNVRQMTAEEFASGAACWYLNGENIGAMHQDLGKDPLPLPDPSRSEVQLKDGQYINVVKPSHAVTVIGGTSSVKEQKAGLPVTLTPEVPSGQVFDHWSCEPAVSFKDDHTFTMPDSPVTATAVFRAPNAEEIPVTIENFGTQHFVNWLLKKADANHDGVLNLSERSTVTSLDSHTAAHGPLKGIAYFPELRSLNFYVYGAAEPLDLRKLPKLEELYIEQTDDFIHTDLDMSSCSNLKVANIGNVKSLRLPENAPLERVQIEGVITAFDLPLNPSTTCRWILAPRSYLIQGNSIPAASLPAPPESSRIGKVSGGTFTDGAFRFDSGAPVLTYQYDVEPGPGVRYVQFALVSSEAQVPLREAFPDPVFRKMAASGDMDDNGILDGEEINQHSMVTCEVLKHGENITSIEGLQYLPNLSTLYLKNIATDTLDLRHLPQVLTLDIVNAPNLRTLHLGEKPALDSLNIQNCQHLKDLDISGCSTTTSLYLPNCSIQKLDLTEFRFLYQIDVSNCRLTSLECSSPDLQLVRGKGNEYIVKGHTVPLSSLPGQPRRENMVIDASCFQDQNTLKIPESGVLRYQYRVAENKLIDCTLVTQDKAVDVTLEAFPDQVFRSYVIEHIDENHNGVLLPHDWEAATFINLPCNAEDQEIRDFTGLQYFSNLQDLIIKNHPVKALDLRPLHNLQHLECTGNPELTELLLPENSCLENLLCQNNKLPALDLSRQTDLKKLDCSENQLASLDLTANAFLTAVNAAGNKRAVSDNSPITDLAGFDKTRASNVMGGSLSGQNVTFTEGTNTITYDYKCSDQFTLPFTLEKDTGCTLRPDPAGMNLLVESKTPCTLVLTAYDSNGRMTDLRMSSIKPNFARTYSFAAYNKAVLVDSNNIPMCPPVTRP